MIHPFNEKNYGKHELRKDDCEESNVKWTASKSAEERPNPSRERVLFWENLKMS